MVNRLSRKLSIILKYLDQFLVMRDYSSIGLCYTDTSRDTVEHICQREIDFEKGALSQRNVACQEDETKCGNRANARQEWRIRQEMGEMAEKVQRITPSGAG